MAHNNQLLPQQKTALDMDQQKNFVLAWELASVYNHEYDRISGITGYIANKLLGGFSVYGIFIEDANSINDFTRFTTFKDMAEHLMPPRSVFDKAHAEHFEGRLHEEPNSPPSISDGDVLLA